MFDFQPPMILFLLKFTIMANCGHSFVDVLELLMAAIYIFLHRQLSKVSIVIGRAFFRKTVFSYVISTCSSHIFLQAGKALRQMHGSGLMPYRRGFRCLQDSIILQMQDIHIRKNFLFHFVEFGIIFRSGELQVFGMCLPI